MTNLPDILELIALVRTVAQRELVPRFERMTQHTKADGSIVTEADLAMQSALQQHLQQRWPGFSFLGEEMEPKQQQALLNEAASGLWVVDPLDGTSNFSLGIPFYSVSVALIQERTIRLGLVYDPARDECFSAVSGQGAWLNQQRLDLNDAQQVQKLTVALVDFKRLPEALAMKLVASPPYKSQRSFGSVALDWCWLAAGRGDVYLHGKQKLWDYAAGHLILEEAGGVSSTLGGEPVFDATLQPRSAVIGINPFIYNQWFSFLSDI